jgi:hypothetical protein
MLISSAYICPVRGLAGLEPPEPIRLGAAAKAAKGLGVKQLMLPVLEEALVGSGKALVRYLDGLIQALDRVDDAGLLVRLIASAQGFEFYGNTAAKQYRHHIRTLHRGPSSLP